tara:strand:+ start:643 stop:2073 length:1431 start_codon:yes stop_codon:yes gene_type:complete
MRKFKGGGSSGPTETTVTQTDLPEYVQPYFERLLQRAEADSIQGYQPYGGQRLAYFSPDELTSQAMTRGYATSGTPQAYKDAQARFGSVAPMTSGYTAGQVQSSYDPREVGQTYQAGTYSPTYQAGGFDAGYDPRTRASQYMAGQALPTYDPLAYEQNLSRFMSPYQQNVIDIEKREAARQSDIMSKGIGDQATAQGGLGGYREAIQQSERERNLAQQLGDIQTRGSQAAFESAQSQLERERAAQLGAAQFGLSRFGAQEGALQTQEQLAQASFSAGEQARQRAAQLGLSAQQQEEAARQAQEKFAQSGFQMQQQALQQEGIQSLQAYQAGESARQQAAKLGLTAAQQNEAARQAQERFAQSAYDMSNRYNMMAAQGLQSIGSAQQADVLSRIGALQGIGAQDRALRQASMDMGYEDFMRQRDFSKRQLSDFSGMLRGVPVQPEQRISTYSQQPGLFQGAVSAGLGGLGLYRGLGG